MVVWDCKTAGHLSCLSRHLRTRLERAIRQLRPALPHGGADRLADARAGFLLACVPYFAGSPYPLAPSLNAGRRDEKDTSIVRREATNG
jgi:hypothetical protein